MPFTVSCWYRKIEKGVNFWPLFTARKCKSVWASGGFAPLAPTRALPWTRWGAYSTPQTPSCVQQWPMVIASCACGATPDPVSGNNWVITKYASQFFKAGYGPERRGILCFSGWSPHRNDQNTRRLEVWCCSFVPYCPHEYEVTCCWPNYWAHCIILSIIIFLSLLFAPWNWMIH